MQTQTQTQTNEPALSAGPPIDQSVIPFWQRFTCTMRDAETVSGLGQTTIYGLIGDGTLESIKVGRRRLVIVPSLRRLLLGDKSEAK